MAENICRKFRLDTQKLHRWFFYAFLVLSTLSLRKIIVSYHLAGAFNEYSSVCIYASDFFLLLAMLFWGISLLCNKNNSMSRSGYDENIVPRGTNCSTWNNLFFRLNLWKRGIKFFYSQVIHNKNILILAIGAIWLSVTIIRVKFPIIAIYSLVRIIEMFLVILYFIKNVPRGTFFRNFLWITLMLGVVNSFIGIGQFIFQHSLGLNFIRESFLSPEYSGVAKLIFNENQVIRAYGLFPHPNVFGGYLLFSICCTIIYYKLFHVEQFVGPKNPSYWKKIVNSVSLLSKIFNKKLNNSEKLNKIIRKIILFIQGTMVDVTIEKISKFGFDNIVPRGTIFPKLIILIQVIALFLTFSKSAILASVITIGYALIKNVPRGTFFREKEMNNKMFHVEHFMYVPILVLIGMVFFYGLFKPDLETFFLKSLYERSFYQNYALALIRNNFWLGVGSGQFVLNLANSLNLPEWQLQPVHNVFLLIFSENGAIGFALVSMIVIFWGNSIMRNVPRGTFDENVFEKIGKSDAFCMQKKNAHVKERWIFCINLIKGLFLGFIVIMLFDHYLWDIHQGKVLFSLLIGLAWFFTYNKKAVINAKKEQACV